MKIHPTQLPVRTSIMAIGLSSTLLCFAGCDEPGNLDESQPILAEGVLIDDEELGDEVLTPEEPEDDGTGPEYAPDRGESLTAAGDPMAISGSGYWSWGTSGNYGAPLDLGTSTSRTCFLQGVTGELNGQWQGARAESRVYMSGGRWWLRTRAGIGSGVMGHATCINTSANRRFLVWTGDNAEGPHNRWLKKNQVNADTQCFLSEVHGTDGWKSSSSFVRVRRQTIYGDGAPYSSWVIGGNLLWEQDNTAGGGATAVCVDVPQQNIGSYSWQSYQSAGATAYVTPEAGGVCGIQILSGNFGYAPLGWWSGVRLFPSNSWWRVFSAGGKRIAGECLADP